MATIARRAALHTPFRTASRTPTRQAFRRNATTSAEADVSAAEQKENKDVLKEGAKRDPELYVYLPKTKATTLVHAPRSTPPSLNHSDSPLTRPVPLSRSSSQS